MEPGGELLPICPGIGYEDPLKCYNFWGYKRRVVKCLLQACKKILSNDGNKITEELVIFTIIRSKGQLPRMFVPMKLGGSMYVASLFVEP